MTGVVIVFHSIFCLLLVLVILMQSGRGGGLTEGFGGAESMFGTQTNELLIRTTTTLAVLFFVTCLSLAFLSSQKSQSLMANKIAPQSAPVDLEKAAVPVPEAVTNMQK